MKNIIIITSSKQKSYIIDIYLQIGNYALNIRHYRM